MKYVNLLGNIVRGEEIKSISIYQTTFAEEATIYIKIIYNDDSDYEVAIGKTLIRNQTEINKLIQNASATIKDVSSRLGLEVL